jgi:hypothetical protein
MARFYIWHSTCLIAATRQRFMKRLLSLTVAAISLAVSYSASGLVVDEFNDPLAHTKIASPPNPPGWPSSSQTVFGAQILGFSRYAFISVSYLEPGSLGLTAENYGGGSPYNGAMHFSSPDSSQGYLYLRYNRSNLGFSPVQDFTMGNTVGALAVAMDADHVSDSYVIFTDSSGNRSWEHQSTAINEGGYVFYFDYAGFTAYIGPNPADLHSIVGVEYYLFGDANGDYAIDYIRTQDRGVPDVAGTMALVAIALGFLGVARLKMKA